MPLCECCYRSPLGNILMISDGMSLTELSFADASGMEKNACPLPVFNDTRRWLDMYFAGQIPDFLPRLSPQGTAFRQSVWNMLLAIPYGQTTSYGEIAAEIGRRRQTEKMSAQAVGGAVGHNPIAIIIPCHRVIGKDGSLTGYGGGLWRKGWLLQLERGVR